jgi:hypothetical protein
LRPLRAATSGSDSDWALKLIDVYPNTSTEPAGQGSKPGMAGFELPTGIEIFAVATSTASTNRRL